MSKLQNILHISSAKTWRGGEQQIAYLHQGLQKVVNQIILCPEDSPLSQWCAEHNISSATYQKRSSVGSLVAFKIWMLCRKHEINIIHVHDSHAHTYACLFSSIYFSDLPIILHRRVDFPIRSNFLSKWKYNHKQISKIVCVSKAIQEILRPDIEDEELLAVVHSAIEIEKFTVRRNNQINSELGIDVNLPIIGNVAALADHKDHMTFLKVAQALHAQKFNGHFVLIGGDAGMEKKIKHYIRDNDMNAYTHLLGFRSDIPTLLASLDLFLFTSKTEGLGTSVIDAVASRIPVVSTNAGGIPEIVQHEFNGLLCAVGDVGCLSKACKRILGDESLQKTFAANAKISIQSFSIDNMCDRMLQIYKSTTG